MDIILFAPDNDVLSGALYEDLKKKKIPVQLVRESELTFAKQWLHEIDKKGNTNTEILLPDNRLINSSKISFCFNRIRSFQMTHFIDPVNQNYAVMEQTALYFSFMKSLGKKLYEPWENNHFNFEVTDNWWAFKCAIESGIHLADFHFTTDPKNYSLHNKNKSNNNNSMIAFSPENMSISSHDLILQNKPVLFLEKFEEYEKITVIGETILGSKKNISSGSILEFSKSIGRKFYEIILGGNRGKYKFCNLNLYPVTLGKETIEALSNSFLLNRISN